MKYQLVAAVLALAPCAAVAGDAAFGSVNIVSGNPSRAAYTVSEILRQKRELGIAAVAPSMQFHVSCDRPETNVAARLELFREIRDAVAPAGVAVGILAQSTLGGHGGQFGPPPGWQRTAFLSGKKSERTCVLEPKFRRYLKETFAAIARERPAFVIVDDDFSVRRWECCCPLHMKEYERALGRRVTADELRSILVDGPLDGAECRAVLEVLFGSYEAAARDIRAAIDSVDPSLRCGICCGGSMRGGIERVALALAGSTRPFVRIANAVYGPQNVYAIVHTFSAAERMKAVLPTVEDVLCEGDTYPHNAMSTPAVRFNACLAANSLSGIVGAKLWMSDFSGSSFTGETLRYERIYAKYRPFRAELLRIAREGVDWRGVAGVVFRKGMPSPPVARAESADPAADFPLSVLAAYAIPVRYAKPGDGGIFAVSAGEALCLGAEERAALAKGPLLLDPECGASFPERGPHTLVSAVSPGASYHQVWRTARRKAVRAQLDELSGGILEMSVEAGAPALVRHGVMKDGSELVAVTWLCADPAEAIPLRMVRSPESAEALSPGGTWEKVGFSRTAPDVVTLCRGATLYEPLAFRLRFR